MAFVQIKVAIQYPPFCTQDFIGNNIFILIINQFISYNIQAVKMFSSLVSPFPGSIVLPPMIPTNPDAHKLITAIRDQTQGTPPHMVYVLDIVSVRFGGYFTAQIRQQLQKYRYLQMLTLNDCGIVSLQNFPSLPALIRLDMVFNSIPGNHLHYITGSKHIQTLMLGANKIENLTDLDSLRGLRQLLQLDLLNNSVVKEPGYRAYVFSIFPSLSILDTLDKIGKDAYNNSTMLQAVSRIPDNLFDKSPPPPLAPIHVPIHHKQKKKLTHALARTGSLDSVSHKPIIEPERKIARGKISKVAPSGRSRSSRAGLIFPVGRLRRHLKTIMVGHKVGAACSVYTAAVLQYLTAQLIQIAGIDAKNNHKKRITPISIRNALKADEQMKKLLQNVTIGMVGSD